MTNAMIVFMQSIRLMEEGTIGTTGREITYEDESGKHTIMEPEAIHTYNGWKERGYQVKKGSKAIAQFGIWKYRSKKGTMEMMNVETGKMEEVEVDKSKMFMKTASWFTFAQVEKIA